MGTVRGVLDRILTVGMVMGCVGYDIKCGYGNGVCWREY